MLPREPGGRPVPGWTAPREHTSEEPYVSESVIVQPGRDALLPGELDLATEVHRSHEATGAALLAAGRAVPAADRAAALLAAAARIAREVSLEQAVLHPALRGAVPGGDALADVRLDGAARLLEGALAAEAAVADPSFGAALTALHADVTAQRDHERRWIVPALVRHLEPIDRVDLAERYASLREALPCGAVLAAAGGPAEDLRVTPVAACFRRARDAARGV